MKSTDGIKKLFSADKQRYITGAILIAALVGILFINSKPLIWFVLGALLLLSVRESLALYTLESSLHFYIWTALLWIGAYFTKAPLYCGLITLITLFGGLLPSLVAGSLLVEYIFNIPGMGTLSLLALSSRDYPLQMALFAFTGMLTLGGIFVSDMLYLAADPRIKLHTK